MLLAKRADCCNSIFTEVVVYKKESIFHMTFNIFWFYGGINQGELSNDINKCICQLDEVQIEFALVTDFEKKCLLKLTSKV